jgi:hypothetical protein
MINAVIADNEGDPWYIPKEEVYNAWTSQIFLTLGNIDLRDFALERKFSDIRSQRVQEYDRKWQEALDKNDKDYLSKHVCPGLAHTLWDNWTQEEKDYYSNSERFPILLNNNKITRDESAAEAEAEPDNKEKKEYIPLWDKRNPIWSVDYSWLLRKYLED